MDQFSPLARNQTHATLSLLILIPAALSPRPALTPSSLKHLIMDPSPSKKGQYPPRLTQFEKDDLRNTVKNWAIGHGLAIRPMPSVVPDEQDPKGMLAINVPVTLFPSPFPRQCFQQAVSVQKTYNELYAAISRDETFLADAVNE